MYGRLGDTELSGGGADGGMVFCYVLRKPDGALLDVCVHFHHSRKVVVNYMSAAVPLMPASAYQPVAGLVFAGGADAADFGRQRAAAGLAGGDGGLFRGRGDGDGAKLAETRPSAGRGGAERAARRAAEPFLHVSLGKIAGQTAAKAGFAARFFVLRRGGNQLD